MATSGKPVLFFAALLLLLVSTVAEAKMVSINRNEVNLRTGPSTGYKVKWELGKGFPLKVIGSKGNWYKVNDFENDVGWVYAPLTSRKAHLVVKKQIINIRSGPGTRYRVVAKAKYGVVLRTLKRVKGWVKVRHENGVTGWAARRLLWGW
jgi:SH3-like domain-containing protein